MRCFLSFLAAVTLLVPISHAGAPRLVRDINSTIITVDSHPGNFLDQGAWSFFTASDGVHPSEPWSTDGTLSGTVRLGSVNALPGGISGYQTWLLGGVTYFTSNGVTFGSSALWRSDGTAAGTRVVKDFSTSAGESAGIVGTLGSQVLLSVSSSVTGPGLWRSDGTSAGTVPIPGLGGLGSAVRGYTVANGRIYFLRDAGNGTYEPWVSDGTAAGAYRLLQMPGFSTSGPEFVQVGNYLLFDTTTPGTGHEIWRIDLGTEVVSLLADIAPGSGSAIDSPQFGKVGSVALFQASSTGGTRVLWRSDGTPGGTYQVAPVTPVSDVPRYWGPTTANRVLFRVSNGAGGAGLWSTDGVTATMLAPAGSCDRGMVGGICYFVAGTSELWRTDGTPSGTRRLNGLPANLPNVDVAGSFTELYVRIRGSGGTRDIYRYDTATDVATLLVSFALPIPLTTQVFAFAQGRLYFDGGSTSTGHELWVSDGTTAGTYVLRNIGTETRTEAASPQHLFAFHGRLFFSAEDGSIGRELWTSDGTAAGTQLVADLNPGPLPSDPLSFFTLADKLYFFANDGPDRSYFKLWTTDGTGPGTQLVTAAIPRNSLFGGQPPCGAVAVTIEGIAYLSVYVQGSSPGLTRTDGTAAGTIRIVGGEAASLTDPCWLVAFQGKVFFSARQHFTVGQELWTMAPGGAPALFVDLTPGQQGSDPAELTVLNDRLYFVALNGASGRQLWVSDGTTAGTHALTSFSGQSPNSLVVASGKVFFYTTDPQGGAELWRSDGTSAGTVRVGTVVSRGPLHSDGTRVYFSAQAAPGSPSTITPWVSDGSTAGTHSLTNLITPVPFSILPWDFNGITLFQSSDQALNGMLWRSNGTRAGTALIGEAGVVSTSLYPVRHQAAGGSFFYVADDGSTGAELFAVSNSNPVASDDDAGSVQAGHALSIPVTANDSDPGGAIDPASVMVIVQPEHGTASVGTGGSIVYTANTTFAGTDQFTYSVADNQGNRSWPAIVRVIVTAAAQPPLDAGSPSDSGGGGGLGISALLGLLWLAGRLARYRVARSGDLAIESPAVFLSHRRWQKLMVVAFPPPVDEGETGGVLLRAS